MAKLEDHVWSYLQTELKILRKLKTEGSTEAWKMKLVRVNEWLSIYKYEVVEDEKYIFSIQEIK